MDTAASTQIRRRKWQTEADLLADGRELLESMCRSTRYAYLYPEGPNLSLLLAAYQELDRLRLVRPMGSRRRQRRHLKRIITRRVRDDALDRSRRLQWGYPTPRLRQLPAPPEIVAEALRHVDADARPFIEAHVHGGDPDVDPAATTLVSGRKDRGLQQFRDALINGALAHPASIVGLHPQYLLLSSSPRPTKRRHPIASLLLVKVPLYFWMAIITLVNVAYIGAYMFFNDEVLGEFVSKRVSNLLDGELEMGSISWTPWLIVDLVTGQPTEVTVTDVNVWEPTHTLDGVRHRRAVHADQLNAQLVLHEIIPWNRIAIPAVFEIPWVLHFAEVRSEGQTWFSIRQYRAQKKDEGDFVSVLGLVDAFRPIRPPQVEYRPIGFRVDDAILSDASLELDFRQTSTWRTQVDLSEVSFRLRHDPPLPSEPRPTTLPFRFGVSGQAREGSFQLDDIDIPIGDFALTRFHNGADEAPLGHVEFAGYGDAGGSMVVVDGTLFDVFTRLAEDPKFGTRSSVNLRAYSPDVGNLAELVAGQLGLKPGTVEADGAPGSAEVAGPLSDPKYHLAGQGLTIDAVGEPAWAMDDASVAVTLARTEVPPLWHDHHMADTRRLVARFHTFEGVALDGTFALDPTGPQAHVVLPDRGEPFLMSANLELEGANPAQLAPDHPETATMLQGTLSGGVAVRRLVVGPSGKPTGPEDPPEGGMTILEADLDFDKLRVQRDHGPRDDGLPHNVRVDGELKLGSEGALDVRGLQVGTDGGRVVVARGGVDGEFTTLDPTEVDLRIEDGRAFLGAFGLDPYFNRLAADMTLAGSTGAPNGTGGRLEVAGVGPGTAPPTVARLAMERGVLKLRTPAAHLYGGTGPISADVTLFARGKLLKDPLIKASIELDGVSLDQLSGGEFSGQVDLKIEIDDGEGNPVPLSDYRVRGGLYAERLTVAGTTYRDVTSAFHLTPEAVILDSLSLPIHRPVSPLHDPGVTVAVGEVVASGSIGLSDDPALDLEVRAHGVPLSVVGRLLKLDVPLRGQIARGTDVRVQGSLRRPSAEGSLRLVGLAASGIALGDGQLQLTSTDVPTDGPLMGHRELRVDGELGTADRRLQWTLDAVVAIGTGRGGNPPVAAQVDVRFDRVALAHLLAKPDQVDSEPSIEGSLQDFNAHLLTCNPGGPMLSDCAGATSTSEQSLRIAMQIDKAWMRGRSQRPPSGDPCNSSTTVCSQAPLVASVDWPRITLDRPWKLATGGDSAAQLELSGSFDLSEPDKSEPSKTTSDPDADASTVAPTRVAVCEPSAATKATGTPGAGHAELKGTLDLDALAPMLESYGLSAARGQLELELAVDGHARAPAISGRVELAPGKPTVMLDTAALPFPVEFSALELEVAKQWLLATGTLRLQGETIEFGRFGSTQTGVALSGPCQGRFNVAAKGTIAGKLIGDMLGDTIRAKGAIDMPVLLVRGTAGETLTLQQLNGRLAFGKNALALTFPEGVGTVRFDQGRVSFERCRGRSCGPDVDEGSIAVFVGGKSQADAARRPRGALHAKVDARGDFHAWGKTFVTPDFSGIEGTNIRGQLRDILFRNYDARGRPVIEAELNTDNLSVVGGAPLILRGDLSVDRSRYLKDVTQGVEILRVTDDVEVPEAPPPEIVRTLRFDINVQTGAPLRIDNNIATGVEAKMNVAIGGSYDSPELAGRIDFEPRGTVDIPLTSGTFEIQRGRVTLMSELGNSEVDVLAQRVEPVYIEGQPRQIALLLGGTLSAVNWACAAEGDARGALDTTRGCVDYLVLGAGDVQVGQQDVRRTGSGGLSNARKPLQVVGHVTELDLGKRVQETIPRYQNYVPETRLRLGQIGPELEISTPKSWANFGWGRGSLGWDYTRGYPGVQLRQSRELKLRLEILDPVTVEFRRDRRSYLNERIIFDPLQQGTLELRFDFEIPSLR